MAKHFGVTPPAVSVWCRRTPLSRMKGIEAFTSGEVSVEEMLSEKIQMLKKSHEEII